MVVSLTVHSEEEEEQRVWEHKAWLYWAKVLCRGPFRRGGDIWTAVSRNRIKLGQSKKDDPTPNPRKKKS